MYTEMTTTANIINFNDVKIETIKRQKGQLVLDGKNDVTVNSISVFGGVVTLNGLPLILYEMRNDRPCVLKYKIECMTYSHGNVDTVKVQLNKNHQFLHFKRM